MIGNSPDEEHIDTHGECKTEIDRLAVLLKASEALKSGYLDEIASSEKRAEEAEALAARRLEGNALLLMWKKQAERERDEARSSLGRVVEALKPFANFARHYDDPPGVLTGDSCELWQLGNVRVVLTVGQIRKARSALQQNEKE